LFFYDSQILQATCRTICDMSASASPELKLAKQQRAWRRRMLVVLLNLSFAMQAWT